ncbi:MAG: hypothetical protein HWE21_03030 [Cytophagia bacterium]|nr:hypothetical protein [Cytophagia bacterium]NVK83265.1 hypothetical protein [Cytophagia bacterium]
MLKQLNDSERELYRSLSTNYLNRMPGPDDMEEPDENSSDDETTDPGGTPPPSGN